ncbi:MAG: histidine kinase-, gyrase and HSP90-like ATPase family protein [bacterium]|nr:histidine kinase-, gyrase and HSP90-like ATPase family protein [bacterium]
MLLHEFIATNSDELLARCEEKVAKRPAPHPPVDMKHGIPQFLKQLTKALREEKASSSAEVHKISGPSADGQTGARSEIAKTAAKHGDELLEQGFTVDQVVHDVTEYGCHGDQVAFDEGTAVTNEHLISVHELRNILRSVTLAFGAIKAGKAGLNGATAAVLDRNLLAMRELMDRLLTEGVDERTDSEGKATA